MQQALCSTSLRPAAAARPAQRRAAGLPVLAVARPKAAAPAAKPAAAKKELQLNSSLAPSEPAWLPAAARSALLGSSDGRWLARLAEGCLALSAAVPTVCRAVPSRPASPVPCCAAVAALAAVNPLADFLQGQADYFSTLGLPQWLVQWGEPP